MNYRGDASIDDHFIIGRFCAMRVLFFVVSDLYNSSIILSLFDFLVRKFNRGVGIG